MYYMKKILKTKTLILMIIAMIVLSTGCSEKNDLEAEVVTETGISLETATEVQETVDQLEETSVESENNLYRTISDMSGRQVEVPSTIEKVFSVNNNGTILLYTLCPAKMVGWNSKLSAATISYLEEDVATLPLLGSLYGNSSQTNPEEVLISNPDIILFMDTNADEKIIAAADKIEKELLIPVVVVKGDLYTYDLAYEFVGELLGEEEKANELIDYYQTSVERINDIVNTIPAEEQVTVYYAREEDGLTTETSKSTNAQLIELCGGINVAVSDDVKIKTPIVSIEQVINWNPDVIFTGNAGFFEEGTYKEIMSNPNWENITAVQEGSVYPTPQAPFNWFDRPPSVNRIIGMNYVLYTLYPEYYYGDIVEDVKSFYSLFYHYDLTNDEANWLLGIE